MVEGTIFPDSMVLIVLRVTPIWEAVFFLGNNFNGLMNIDIVMIGINFSNQLAETQWLALYLTFFTL